MKSTFNKSLLLSSFALASLSAFAEKSENFKINGTLEFTIPLTNINNNINSTYDLEALNGFKTITLMAITPSEKFLKKHNNSLSNRKDDDAEIDYSNGITSFSAYDPENGSVDLGMAKTPVLDQGKFGTCVTFASTAAMDAKLKKGDFIDQQCSLALNKSLGNDFWHGANNATEIFDPLKQYGIVKKNTCADETSTSKIKYPNSSQEISMSDYVKISNKDFSSQMNYNFIQTTDLNSVKAALNAKHRVVMGFSLVTSKKDKTSAHGFDMLINGSSTPTKGGLWACTQNAVSDKNYCDGFPNAGHEVVIIGYDDSQQLLKIRNSWSDAVGDSGNFYMTYTYFNMMAMDHTEIK